MQCRPERCDVVRSVRCDAVRCGAVRCGAEQCSAVIQAFLFD